MVRLSGKVSKFSILANTSTIDASHLAHHPQVDPPAQTRSALTRVNSRFRDYRLLTTARHELERALAIQRRQLGPRHPDVIDSEARLSEMLFLLGDLPEARKIFERVMRVRRLTLGETHPLTLSTMSELAEILCAQGDFETASQLQEFVLDARIRIFGEQHPDTRLAEERLYDTLMETGALFIY